MLTSLFQLTNSTSFTTSTYDLSTLPSFLSTCLYFIVVVNKCPILHPNLQYMYFYLATSSYSIINFQRKRSRLADSSPTQANDQHFLPKMNTNSQKPGSFQPTFTSTYGATQLPKLGATSTYLPTLSTHTYVPKPAKPKPQVSKTHHQPNIVFSLT